MSADANIQEMVKAMIQTQIIAALNSAPEVVEKLVKAAISLPVDPQTGSPNSDSWGRAKVPFLDFIVGQEIRNAARDAVAQAIKDRQGMIADIIKEKLQDEAIVGAMAKAFIKAAEEDWRIQVNFDTERR